MRDVRVAPPQISTRLFRLFGAYVDWYLPRQFGCVRVAGAERLAASDEPLLVVMNHPSWWDPLVALALARHRAPNRNHYAPIDADALEKYKFFKKLGFFGVERDRAAGTASFLRCGEAILRQPGSTLWVTAQGAFTDVRVRPVVLKRGVEHLLERLNWQATALPVALEYQFGPEKLPEVSMRVGEPVLPRSGCAQALQQVQDHLAEDVMQKRFDEYEVLLERTGGVSAVYDLWRGARAALSGHEFHRAHGA